MKKIFDENEQDCMITGMMVFSLYLLIFVTPLLVAQTVIKDLFGSFELMISILIIGCVEIGILLLVNIRLYNFLIYHAWSIVQNEKKRSKKK